MKIRVGHERGDIVGKDSRAIQMAADIIRLRGGGTVELAPGTYDIHNSVLLASRTVLAGSGEETILKKSDGFTSPLNIDADYAQTKFTPEDASGFRPGTGVMLADGRSGGWHTTVTTVERVEGGAVHVRDRFVSDYSTDRGGKASTVFAVVSAVDVEGVEVRDLVVEGNSGRNEFLNGCRGGGIYFQLARKSAVRDCVVRDFNGDGISFQTTQDVAVERCRCENCAGHGIHPGTGSARATIRNCTFRGNERAGFFLCWRVQEGRFEGNEIVENGVGISVGHKDTDNLFEHNTVQRNRTCGILFRKDKHSNAGSRNVFRANTIQENGDCEIRVRGETTDLLFESNTVRGKTAFLFEEKVGKVELRENSVEGETVDERKG